MLLNIPSQQTLAQGAYELQSNNRFLIGEIKKISEINP
jgi:hypothetical protein